MFMAEATASPTSPGLAIEQYDPEAMSPPQCKIIDKSGGQAAVHHAHQHLIIEAHNGNGARMTQGGDAFFASIRGPARVRGRVNDNGDGSYQCVWTPPLSGTYAITISSFGITLAGSPFTCVAAPPQPYAPMCAVSGSALTSAVARATQTFDVEFKDRLGYVTHAVDLDVYLEQMPLLGSPRAHNGMSAGPTSPERSESPVGTRPSLASEATRQATPVDQDGEVAFVRERNIRYMCKGTPLVIRSSVELDSPQIGTINPGQMFTVVMERGGGGRVRAMISLETISRHAEGVGAGTDSPRLSSPRVAPGLLTMPTSPSTPTSPSAAALSPPPALPTGDGAAALLGSPMGMGMGILSPFGEAADAFAPSSFPEGSVGWVTTIRHGKRLVTSKVRQSTTSRQAHAEQWVRRAATDRAMNKSKADLAARNNEGERSSEQIISHHMIILHGMGSAAAYHSIA